MHYHPLSRGRLDGYDATLIHDEDTNADIVCTVWKEMNTIA